MYSLEVPHWSASNGYPQHVDMEDWRKLPQNYHQIVLLNNSSEYVHQSVCCVSLHPLQQIRRFFFSSEKYWHLSYFSTKTYVVGRNKKNIMWIPPLICSYDCICIYCWFKSRKYWHFYATCNPSLAEHNMPCLSKQCNSRSLASEEANWSGSALFAIKDVNSYQNPGSSNLIGWKLEVGVAS